MGRHANVALFVPHEGCPNRCSFCDQKAISGRERPPRAADVKAACERAAATMHAEAGEAEIAFFGGSFTAIDRPYMVELLEAAAPFVRDGRFAGIRVSTRPDRVNGEVLALLKGYGATAVELGAQSMDDTVLARNGRGHTAADVRTAAARIRAAGLSLGLQMMTGLPGADQASDRETAGQLAALQPDTMRVYPTIVMRGTRLARWYEEGRYTPQTLEEAVELGAELLRFFEWERGIPVIRLGLHAGPELEAGRVAGPWHPAFRELCEGCLYLELARQALAEVPAGAVTLLVHPGAVSKLVGQKRCNIMALQHEGYTVTVRGDETVPPRQVTLGGKACF